MTAISAGDLTTIRGSGSHATATYLTVIPPRIMMRSRVSGTSLSFPLGVLALAGTTFPGGLALADVKPGMEIWVGTATDLSDVWVGRVREPTSTSSFKVSEVGSGEHTIPQVHYREITTTTGSNFWVTVVETMAVNYALPLISSGVIYKDWDDTYTDQNETTGIPPMANITFEDDTRPVGFVDSGTSEYRFKVTMDNSWEGLTGNAVASQLWALASNMSLVGGYALSDATIEVDATAGGGWIECTVTASNAETHTARVPTYYYNNTSEVPYQVFAVESDNEDKRGRTVGINTYVQDIPLDVVPHGAMCYLWSVDTFGGTQVSASRDVMLCWALRENMIFNARRPSFTLELATAGHLLGQCVATPQMVESNASPSNWQEVIAAYCNVPGMIHYLFHWHLKTLAALLDVREPLGGEDWADTNQTAFGGQDLGDTNMGRQFDGLASRVPAQWGTTSDGRFYFIRDPQYIMPPAVRNNGQVATRITLTREDIRDIQASRNHRLNTSLVRGSAFIWQGAATEMKPALSQAPDLTPAQSGGGRNDLDGMIVQSQTALNWLTGAHWAVSNQPWTFTVTLDRMLDVFNPAEGDRVAITLTADDFDDPVFGSAFLRLFDLQADPNASTTRNFYIESVMVERPQETSQKTVRLTLFPELTPTPGVTIPILGPGEYPEYGALFANFNFPIPQLPSLSRTYRTPDSKTVYALVYVPSTSVTHIVKSTNFFNMNVTCTWSAAGSISSTDSAVKLVVDPNDSTKAYALVGTNLASPSTSSLGRPGDTVYRTTDLTAGSPTWTSKGDAALPNVTSLPAGSKVAGTMVMDEANADWIAINQFERDSAVPDTNNYLHYMSTGDWSLGAASQTLTFNSTETLSISPEQTYFGMDVDKNGTGNMVAIVLNRSPSAATYSYFFATAENNGAAPGDWTVYDSYNPGAGEFCYYPKTLNDGTANDFDVLYMAGSPGSSRQGESDGVWISTDGGATWDNITPFSRYPPARYNQALVVSESNADYLAFCGYSSSLVQDVLIVTRDAGTTWNKSSLAAPFSLATYVDGFYGDLVAAGGVSSMAVMFEWNENFIQSRSTSDIDTIVGTATWWCEDIAIV